MVERTQSPDPTPPQRGGGHRPGRREGARIDTGAWLVGILAALAIAWTLRATVWVSMPLAFGFFVALSIWPVCAWVEERVPRQLRWLGYVAAMLVLLAFLAMFIGGIWLAAQTVIAELPKYADTVEELWDQARIWIRDLLPPPVEITGLATDDPRMDATRQAGAQQGARIVEAITGGALRIVNSVGHTLALVVLILFIGLLGLVEASAWRDKIASAAGARAHIWVGAVATIAHQIRRYLLVRTALGILTGLLYGLWLWIFGIDLILVWGLLAFLLNYIPTIGSLVAGILPVILVFLQKDLGTAVIVALGLTVIEQVMGNYIDPRLQGRQLSISPLVVLFVLLVWSWIWGIAGALLAVPMTVSVMIVFAQIPALQPIALFLSNERDLKALGRRTQPD